jgi:hypothetical protein
MAARARRDRGAPPPALVLAAASLHGRPRPAWPYPARSPAAGRLDDRPRRQPPPADGSPAAAHRPRPHAPPLLASHAHLVRCRSPLSRFHQESAADAPTRSPPACRQDRLRAGRLRAQSAPPQASSSRRGRARWWIWLAGPRLARRCPWRRDTAVRGRAGKVRSRAGKLQRSRDHGNHVRCQAPQAMGRAGREAERGRRAELADQVADARLQAKAARRDDARSLAAPGGVAARPDADRRRAPAR